MTGPTMNGPRFVLLEAGTTWEDSKRGYPRSIIGPQMIGPRFVLLELGTTQVSLCETAIPCLRHQERRVVTPKSYALRSYASRSNLRSWHIENGRQAFVGPTTHPY